MALIRRVSNFMLRRVQEVGSLQPLARRPGHLGPLILRYARTANGTPTILARQNDLQTPPDLMFAH